MVSSFLLRSSNDLLNWTHQVGERCWRNYREVGKYLRDCSPIHYRLPDTHLLGLIMPIVRFVFGSLIAQGGVRDEPMVRY